MAAPTASIVIPTRGRPDYLAVALASVEGQAREAGAEVLVVEDDVATEATRAVAGRHGARHVALGAFRGLNVARNEGVALALAPLVCFLDDDVEVWPGWLGALLEGAEHAPEHEAFGGPIRARLEGSRLRLCGAEPPPVTTLDLGPQDCDADFVWGANFALRRRAVERIGGFDPELNWSGDEEDWQRRLRAARGRIRYLARAGVDHRRTGADARLPSLTRARWARGGHARRWDERKGTAPSVARELRVLAGCAWHAGRHGCANGIVLGAEAAGRLRAALRPADGTVAAGAAGASARGDADARGARAAAPQGPATAAASDGAATGPEAEFLSGRSGTLSRRGILRGRALDSLAGALTLPRDLLLRRAARRTPPRRVLVLGVARESNAAETRRLQAELQRSHHRVEVRLAAGTPGRGKWANLNAALERHPARGHDWLLLVDDDVSLPRGFLDAFLLACESAGLVVAQPAHAYASHAAWPVTRRRPAVLARRTRFVEIGPVTAIRADAFAELLPFPDVRMGWGLDFLWSGVADRRGWAVGVVDATPVRHLTPVAAHYDHAAAVREGVELLRGHPRIARRQADMTVARRLTWRS